MTSTTSGTPASGMSWLKRLKLAAAGLALAAVAIFGASVASPETPQPDEQAVTWSFRAAPTPADDVETEPVETVESDKNIKPVVAPRGMWVTWS